MGKQTHHIHSSEVTLIETPYSAFRKRNDRIVTRRYRKFDKQNYEKLDQFKKAFGLFYRITELIYSREVLKNKLILLLQATFFQRNIDQSWIDTRNVDFHTDTYFLTTIPSYFHDHMIEAKQISTIDDTKYSNSLHHISSNKFKCSEECIPEEYLPFSANVFYHGSRDISYLSTIDGKFSFLPNTTSKYIHPSTNYGVLIHRISSTNNSFNRSIDRFGPSSSYKMYRKYPSRLSILRPLKKSFGMVTSSCTHFHTTNSIFQLD